MCAQTLVYTIGLYNYIKQSYIELIRAVHSFKEGIACIGLHFLSSFYLRCSGDGEKSLEGYMKSAFQLLYNILVL